MVSIALLLVIIIFGSFHSHWFFFFHSHWFRIGLSRMYSTSTSKVALPGSSIGGGTAVQSESAQNVEESHTSNAIRLSRTSTVQYSLRVRYKYLYGYCSRQKSSVRRNKVGASVCQFEFFREELQKKEPLRALVRGGQHYVKRACCRALSLREIPRLVLLSRHTRARTLVARKCPRSCRCGVVSSRSPTSLCGAGCAASSSLSRSPATRAGENAGAEPPGQP